MTLYIHYLTILMQSYDVGKIITIILQMEKLEK